MSRRRKLLLVALVLGATGLYALWRAPEWGVHLVETTLSRAFKRPVTVQHLGLRLATGELELSGLRVGGVTPEAPPFLEIDSVRVRPSVAPWRGNRIVLSRVRLEGMRLRIHAFPSPPLGPGGDDIPKLGGGGGGRGGLGVAIERLVIVGGEFVLDHERVPLDLDLPEFRGRLLGRREGGVAGHISFEPGRLKMGSAPELQLGTEIDVIVNRGVVDVQGARVFADNINLAYHGRIRFAGRPQGQLSLEGPVDLAVLERHVFRSGLGFAGRARWAGLLSIDGSRLRIEGRMQGEDGEFRGVRVQRFASWLSYDGTSGLVMRELDVATLGGKALLSVDVPPTATHLPVSIRGRLDAADGEGVLRMLFGWGELGIGTAATGDVDVSWPKGRDPPADGPGQPRARRTRRRPPASRRPLRLDGAGRSTELRAARARGPRPRRARERRGGRAGPRAPRARGRQRRPRRHRGRAHPRAPGARQPRGAAGGVLGRADASAGRWGGTLDWPVFEGRFDGGESATRASLGRGRLVRELRHRGRVDHVAPAGPAQGRRGDRMGGAQRGRLARPEGRARGTRARDALAGRGPGALHGVGRGGERAGDRDRERARPAQRPRGRGAGHRPRRPLLRRRLRRGAPRVPLASAARRGDARRGAPRRRPRPLRGQRERRRRLRRRAARSWTSTWVPSCPRPRPRRRSAAASPVSCCCRARSRAPA